MTDRKRLELLEPLCMALMQEGPSAWERFARDPTQHPYVRASARRNWKRHQQEQEEQMIERLTRIIFEDEEFD